MKNLCSKSNRSVHAHNGFSESKACLFVVSLAACLIGGCASQVEFRAGKEFEAAGRPEQALAKYEEALRLTPRDAEVRSVALSLREQLVYRYLAQAARHQASGQPAEARSFYAQALALDPQNERARIGLADIAADPRLDGWMDEAAAALKRGDVEAARAKLRLVLTERPEHARAKALSQSIAERPAPPSNESLLGEAFRKPLSIDFKDATVKQVLDVISQTSGLNILFDKDVRTDQKVSLVLRNSTVEAVLHYTLSTSQLERRTLDGNTILIYPNNAQKQKDYQDLLVKTFYLSNADAKTVAATLKTVLKTREAVADDKLNLVIVRDGVEAVRLAEKLVAILDVPEAEVMLEVEILEVKRSRLEELGIRWPDSLVLTPLPDVTGSALTLRSLRELNSASTGATLPPLTLTARLQNGNNTILANPRIRVRNREKAKILIGDRVPNITSTSTSTGFVAESITYLDVGLKLDVEPTVSLDGAVTIRVAMEVSNIASQLQTKGGSVAYQIGTRNASTVLRLNDGENQVLAGLINDEDRRNGNKIPGLGELPVTGRLFGSTSNDAQRTEIVLSITPRIIRNVQRLPAELSEFASGTELMLRTRPELLGRQTTASANAEISSLPAVVDPLPASSSGLPLPTPTSAAPAAASATLQGPSQIRTGERFSVDLMWNSEAPITGVAAVLGFDPKYFDVVGVADGGFLGQAGGQTSFAQNADKDGQLALTATRITPGAASGSGKIASIDLRAKAAVDGSVLQLWKVDSVPLAGGQLVLPVAPSQLSVRVQQ